MFIRCYVVWLFRPEPGEIMGLRVGLEPGEIENELAE